DPPDTRWWDSSARLLMKRYSLGYPNEHYLDTTGGGHGFAYYNRQAERTLKFLVDRLEQERRRLP
ncbi:MAG: esterase, partial [Planctomycetota bacterium]